MASNHIKLRVNPTPAIASAANLALAIWGFLNPERMSPWVSLGLFLIALLLLFQLKRITISSQEIIVKRLFGNTKRIPKKAINSIYHGTYQRSVGKSISSTPRMISIRTHAKQTITISTSSISENDFQGLMVFLQKYYTDKLH